jgi:hypothetical protein
VGLLPPCSSSESSSLLFRPFLDLGRSSSEEAYFFLGGFLPFFFFGVSSSDSLDGSLAFFLGVGPYENIIHVIISIGIDGWFMLFNATFNNISNISWQSVLLVEETEVPGENHQPVTSH